jgi:hypothetical protein
VQQNNHHRLIRGVRRNLHARSVAVLSSLETRLDRMMRLWMVVALLACSARAAAAPLGVAHTGPQSIISYLLVILAPVVSTLLALRWFADPDLISQPSSRLAFAGRWRPVSKEQAQAHPLYGTTGIMVSLLVGMLLNVPVRVAEYLAAIPPIPSASPEWLSTLQVAMTFDVVLFTCLYPIAFVAALKRVPLFPRMLVAIWILDITMQLGIARVVAGTHLPHAVGDALQTLLMGNVKKVLISVCLWLPYLLLSTRVNVTYRQRVPA